MKKRAKTNNQYGLEVKSFPKHKQWAVDQDYIKDLSPADQDWLGKFNQEYYRNRVTKGSKTALHNTDALRESCYSRENSANRDLFAIKSVGSAIVGDSTVVDEDGNAESMIDRIADEAQILDFDAMDKRLKTK